MKSCSLSSFTIHGMAAANGVDSESVSWPTRMCIFCRRRIRWGCKPNGRRPCGRTASLGPQADRPRAMRPAGLQERIPDMLAVGRGEVDLVADLADEADAQDQ